MTARVVCAVLAAGASRRLGYPKQLALFKGEPLVHSAARVCCESRASATSVIVGAHAAPVRSALGALPIDVLENADWQEGVAASIRVAVAWALLREAAGLLLCLCDQPRLDAAHLDQLIAEHERTGLLVASRYADKNAVPALFPRAHFAALAELSGDSGASRLLNRGSTLTSVAWPNGVFDVDTYEAARQLL